MNNSFESNWLLEEYRENIEYLLFILQKELALLKHSKPLDEASLLDKEMLINLIGKHHELATRENIFQTTSKEKHLAIKELAQNLLQLNSEVRHELEKSVLGTQRLINDIRDYITQRSQDGYTETGSKTAAKKHNERFLALNDKI